MLSYLTATQICVIIKYNNVDQLRADTAQRNGGVQLSLLANEQNADIGVINDKSRLGRRIGGIQRYADPT
ncbi:hypothetical protein D3C75_1265060 [compost metagenome]